MQLSEASAIFAGKRVRFGDALHLAALGRLRELADCRAAQGFRSNRAERS
jgi:hypothetical protein